MSVKGTINLLSIPYLRASFVIDFSLALLTISRLYSPYPSVRLNWCSSALCGPNPFSTLSSYAFHMRRSVVSKTRLSDYPPCSSRMTQFFLLLSPLLSVII